MSQENPTPEELAEIEQFQHGAYGAQPPEWWFNQKNTDRDVIPAEAVEAAAQALRDAFDWGVDGFDEQAKRALEAAAPYMQQVSDDALRAAWDRGYAKAVEGMKDVPEAAWDEGYSAGKSDAFAEDKGFTGYHANPFRSTE